MDAQSQPPRPPEAPQAARVKPDGCTGGTQYKGFKEAHREQQLKRRNRTKPPPWIARKLAVFIVYGLIVFATYVYIGRVCVPLIRRDPDAVGGGRGVGISLLSIFCILWVMCVWTYTKVVLTPPGFARDFVPKVTPPSDTVAGPRYEPHEDDYDDESIDHYDYQSRDDHESRPRSTVSLQGYSRRSSASVPRVTSPDTFVAGQTDPESTAAETEKPSATVASESGEKSEVPDDIPRPGVPGPEEEQDVGEFHAFPGTGTRGLRKKSLQASDSTAAPSFPPQPPSKSRGVIDFGGNDPPPPSNDAGLPPESTSRQPPRHPILAPEYRYCSRDQIIKPYRTHHCRVCATCVLNFDHHCPWIGQCVGARNRKFFMNFVLWGCLFCLWTSISLIVINAQSGGDPDPPSVVVIVLTMILGLFTLGLFITHTYLLTLNLTTIEEYSIKGMKEREEHVLASMWPWWAFRAKRRTVRSWDEEWGRLKTEGNIWWLGSPRKNWEQTMGKNPWGWFLPIGESEVDGLAYPTNPRFTKDGRWRRRAEWDPEYR